MCCASSKDGESGILYNGYCQRVKFRLLPIFPLPDSIIWKIMYSCFKVRFFAQGRWKNVFWLDR